MNPDAEMDKDMVGWMLATLSAHPSLGIASPQLVTHTGANAATMGPAIAALARLALKLARGEALGPAEVDGYLGRGVRVPTVRTEPGHARVATQSA